MKDLSDDSGIRLLLSRPMVLTNSVSCIIGYTPAVSVWRCLGLLAFILACPLLGRQALAGDPEGCGTVVVPTGIGIGPSADITSLNPLFVDSIYNEQAAWLLYPALVWVNRFHQIDWRRSLVSAISSPDGGRSYAVTLRPWHWSDGVPVRSADVAYALTLIRQLGETWPGFGNGGMPGIIQSLQVADNTHFDVVLTHQANSEWFIYNGLSALSPLPEHAWRGHSIDQLQQLQSSPEFFKVVDGPLKISRLQVGQDAVFVPNPAYQGPPLHFGRLVFRFLESDGAGLQGVQSGDLDMANLPFSLWGAAAHLRRVYTVMMAPQQNWYFISINFRNPAVAFFRDVRVREAMADAIDQRQLSALVYHGQGIEIYGPVPPDPPDFLSPEMKAGHQPVGYDPGKARALLLAAGFLPGPDGIMVKAGQRLAFDFLFQTGDTAAELVTNMLGAEFRQAGIEIRVHEMEFNQLVARIDGPADGWESAYIYMNLSPYPSGEGLFRTGAFQNNGAYSNKRMDALIDASVNRPGQAGLYAYEDYASAQQPVVFAGGQKITVLAASRIHGVREFLDPLGQLAPEQLYCSAVK
jgi:peptide/nickel transport system substrate-binding protein